MNWPVGARRIVLLLLAIWLCGVGAATATAADIDAKAYGRAKVGGSFVMTDHTGRTVTDQDFRGRFMLMYFGYTHCPDVCPTDLYNIAVAMDMLGEDGAAVQPVFVSVDPRRDTVEQLADYVPLYHPKLIGLRGTPEQTEDMARKFHVFYSYYEDRDSGEYQVDHTAYTYLMGPEGEYLTYFPFDYPPAMMADEIRGILKGFAGNAQGAVASTRPTN